MWIKCTITLTAYPHKFCTETIKFIIFDSFIHKNTATTTITTKIIIILLYK